MITSKTVIQERTCRVCGCTDNDCSQCIAKTGMPCYWVEKDLCSACVAPPAAKTQQQSKMGALVKGTINSTFIHQHA